MADRIYEVDGGDGRIYEVQAPEGASESEILSIVQLEQFKALGGTSRTEPEEPEESEEERRRRLGSIRQEEGLFSTGVGRGIDLLQQMYGSAIEGVGDVTGLEGLERYGASVIEENRRQLEETAGATRSTKDIDSLGGLADYAAATFGAQVPQLGSTLAGAGAGAVAGSFIPVIGTGVGAIIGGIAANLPFFYGSNREAQKEEIEAGNRQEISEGAAALTAIPQSVLDYIADRFLIGGFTSKAAMGGGIFTRGAKGVGAGIVTEVPTEIGQQVLERLQAGQDLTSDEALDEYFEVGVAAGLVGGTVRGAGNVYGGRKRFEDDPDDSVDPVDPAGVPTLREGQEQGELFPSSTVTERAPDMARLVEQLRAEEAAAVEQERVDIEREAAAQGIELTSEQVELELENRRRPPTTPDPRQGDFIDAAETAQLEEMEAAAEAKAIKDRITRAQEGPVDETLRPESELQTIEGQLDTQQQQETTQRRGEVLDSVLTDLGTASRTTTAQRFSDALADAGIGNTTPTQQEYSLINRATDVVAATRTQRDDAPPVGPVPTRQEARAEAAAQRETADQTAAEQRRNRRILTEEDLAWGPKRIKELKGQDVGNPGPARDTLQKQLETLQKNAQGLKQPRAIEANQLKQQKIRGLLAGERVTASPVSDVATTPTSEQATQQEGQATEGTQDVEQLELFGDPIESISLDRPTGRTGDVDPVPQAVPVDADTTGPAAPAAAGVDTTADNLRGAIGRTGDELVALERAESAEQVKAKRERKPGKKVEAKRPKKKPAAKKATPKKAADKKPAAKKPAAKKPAAKKPAAKKAETQKPFETRVDEDGNTVTIVPEGTSGRKKRKSSPKSKQLEIEVGERSDLKFFTEAQPTWARREIAFTDNDVAKVDKLVRSKRTRAEQRGETAADKDKAAARTYFGRKEDPIEALEEIAHEAVFANKQHRKDVGAFVDAENQYMAGKGKTTAKRALNWARANLDAATVKQLDDFIAAEQAALTRGELNPDADIDIVAETGPRRSPMSDAYLEANEKQVKSYVDAELDDRALQDLSEINIDDVIAEEGIDVTTDKYLFDYEVVGLDLPAHPVINNLLRAGKLREALQTLAITSPSNRVSQVARKLAQRLGDTKVEVLSTERMTELTYVDVSGVFDPKTNTIYIDENTGINPHTILHETTHALTSATLANKSHPVTKQLQKLFDSVKDQIDTFYGAQSLDEFVAEAFGNSEFQTKLAGLRPDGSQISALQRFFNTVGNFVRRMLGMQTKPIDSALNQADIFIEAMLAPAPSSRGAGMLYLNRAKLGKNIDAIQQAFNDRFTKADRQRTVDRFKDIFLLRTTSPRVKKILAYVSPMQLIAQDVAPAFGLNSGPALYEAIDRLQGDINNAETRVDGTMRQLTAYFKSAGRKHKEAFDRLVYASTRAQVHPYETPPKKGTPERDAYDAMEKDKDLIGKEGAKMYKLLENAYLSQFDELKTVLSERINNLDIPDAQKEKLQKNIFDKLFEKGRLKPYFPLTRKGDLWLSFEAKDAQGNPEMVQMAFESPSARKSFVAQLMKDNKTKDADGYGPGGVKVSTINEYQNADQLVKNIGKDAPATAFVGQVLATLQANKVDADVQNEFMELFLNALPESSFAKSLSRRGNEGAGTTGFIQDAQDAFRQKGYNMAAQIQRMKAGNSIDEIAARLDEEYRTAQENNPTDQENTKIIFDELMARASFAKNPPKNAMNRFAVQVNRFAFLGTLGLNVSSAVVNLSQIPLMMAPILGGKYGYTETYHALRDASTVFSGSGGTRKIGTIGSAKTDVEAKAAWSMDNYFDTMEDGSLVVRPEKLKGLDPNKPEDKKKIDRLNSLKTLVEVAGARGQLNRSMFYDTMGVETSGRDKTTMDYISAGSAWIFHHAERYNRQVALVATYNLELNRLNSDKATKAEKAMSAREKEVAAANEAVFRTQEMNGGAFLATAPRIAQQGLGRIGMMYKTFGVQMYATMFKIARQSFLVDLPRNLKEQGISDGVAKTMSQTAFRQLKGIMASSLLLAGVQGMPIYGAVAMIANAFRDEDEEDFETSARQYLGEGLYKGGVNALFGVDVANRIGLSNLLFRMNPYNKDRSLVEVGAELFAGPGVSVASQMYRGFNDIIDGKGFYRGVETMSPSAVRNAFKTYRYWDEGAAKTRRGDIIADDITSGELLFQFFGFAPTKVTFEQERNMSTKNIDRATNERRTNILRQLYISYNTGDSEGYQDALDEMNAFNERHPYFMIDNKAAIKSLLKHYDTTAGMYNGITISPKLRAPLENHRDDYWGRNEWNLTNIFP